MPELTPIDNDRRTSGARSALAILEALDAHDTPAARLHVEDCDPVPTLLALATAWLTLAEINGRNVPGLLLGMHAAIPEATDV